MWTLLAILLLFLTIFVWQWLATVWVILIVVFNVALIVSKMGITFRTNPSGIFFGLLSVLPNIILAVVGIVALIWAFN